MTTAKKSLQALLFIGLLATGAQLHAQSTTGIYVNSSNNVGIGTANPAYKLDVYDSGGTGTVMNFNSSVNGSSDWGVRFGGNKGFIGFKSFGVNGGGVNDLGMASGPGGNLLFGYNGGTEGMRITAGGNVGIGTTNPMAAKLAVLGNISFDGSSVNQERIIGLQRTDGAGWTNTPHMSFKTDGNGDGYLTFSTLNSGIAGHPDMVVFNYDGNVGIGTTTPLAAKLAVIGNISFDAFSSNQERIIGLQRSDGAGWTNTPHLSFKTDGNANGYITISTINSGVAGHPDMVTFNYNGNVGIGTTSPQYMLDVAGQVRAAAFVAPSQTYADFVFKPGYKLEPLSDVEASIQKDGHLPGIPSEAEAKAHGIDLASMQVKLLQKIEELTLHVISQEKRLDEQNGRIDQLEKENAELREGLTK
jgi:hypothetical protein